jgi:DNA-binding IclR family transcriptional regulator
MTEERTSALEKAVLILDCFSQENTELGVRETARLVGLSSSATGRLMTAMRDLGLLVQNPRTRLYTLGTRVLVWAGTYLASSQIDTAARTYINELHLVTRETVSLYVLDDNERVCIERLDSPQSVRFVARVGKRLPLYAGASGKVMLAFLKPMRRDEILNSTERIPLTNTTITEWVALEKDLALTCERGYAVSIGEWTPGATGIAAPIFDRSNEVVGALNLSGPSSRFTEEVIRDYAAKVCLAAANISRALGAHRPVQTAPVAPAHAH